MRFVLPNRSKVVAAFKLLDYLSPDSYSLRRFQVIRFVFANRIRVVVASKLLDHWLGDIQLFTPAILSDAFCLC